jgi:hypothetical protein
MSEMEQYLQVVEDPNDFWWQARQKTAKMQSSLMARTVAFAAVSFPRAPTRASFAVQMLGDRSLAVIMPDFNKYRVGRDLRVFVDAGADAFMFRMGGPLQWNTANFMYTMDPSWRPYMEAADRIGFLDKTIGYIVHNPFELFTINGATGETVHTSLIDDWTTGGYMPRAFVYDHEVKTAWQGGVQITATNYNLVRSLEVNTQNTWEKFRRRVGIYSARWFINSSGKLEHETYFYNVNRPASDGGVGIQRPLILAWYPQTFTSEYQSLEAATAQLLVPTASQTSSYLWSGVEASAWQFSDRVKLPGDATGVDMSISLVPRAEFFNQFGLLEDGSGPAEPPPPPVADAELTARVAALELRMGVAENQLLAVEVKANSTDDRTGALETELSRIRTGLKAAAG